ncbi:MAG: DUF58 domain-containing protein [Candidatus Hydrogenedentes bacterium]|nr:DUF58 domain-containing protein [Candidatus Hydrogenedentota bacterium]
MTRRFVNYLWGFKTTATCKFVIGGLLLSGVVGSRSLQMPVYQLFCGLSAVLGTALLAGWVMRPRVTAAGGLPEKACAGHAVSGSVTLTNHARRAAYDVSARYFGLPPSLEPAAPDSPGANTVFRLDPGETACISVSVHPLRRGLYPLPELRPYSTFPFGLWRMAGAGHDGGKLLVLPDFHPLNEVVVPVGTRYQPGGIALTSNVGESPEYIGNREYRPGDPWRQLDFRSWARLAKPVVREFQEEYYHRIALVLDTFVPGRRRIPPAGFPQLEAAVSLAAAVADGLSRGEYIIDLFAAGPELYVFRAGRHISHFESVLEILACVDACRRNPFDTVTPAIADELASVSTVICVFLDWDAARRGLVRTAIESGCEVKVLIVRDGEPSEPIAGADTADIAVYTPGAVREGELDTV